MASVDNLDRYTRYALFLGEDTYASPSAQSPDSARKVTGLYPSLAGDLTREQRRVAFLASQLPGRIVMLEQFNWFDSATRLFTSFYFVAADNGSGTAKLYRQKVGTDTDWVQVTDVGTLAAYPVGHGLNNLFHLSDGTNSWIFDGTSWVKDGLERPVVAPQVTVSGTISTNGLASLVRSNGVVSATMSMVSSVPFYPTGFHVTVAGATDTSFNGTFAIATTTVVGSPSHPVLTWTQIGSDSVESPSTATIIALRATVAVNRYYWTTFADKTATRLHESSSSPRSLGTGAFTDRTVQVKLCPGAVVTTSGSPAVLGSGTDFKQSDVGKMFTLDGLGGASPVLSTPIMIASVTDSQHLTLASNINITGVGAFYIIYPPRATHWRVYASASEEDKAGLLLLERSLLVQTDLQFVSLQSDGGPFIDQPNQFFQKIERPIRNDPTPPTSRLEVHKRRIFRRRETQPNFFNYSSYEEVLNLANGTPEECVPGADSDSISDRVNESSYPDESDHILGLCSHGGALFVGTENSITPLFGESIDDFGFSDVAAFSVGVGGKNAMKSTMYGFLFGSSDRKIYLYPSSAPPASNATSSLIELSRPKRPTFEGMSSTRMDEWFIVHYNWGRRNWIVTSFYNSSAYVTYVLDMETKTWMQLSLGYSALQVFTLTSGKKVLIGGTEDGHVYVIDDQTGTYAGAGNFSEGMIRTALLDFGRPDRDHTIYAVEYEKSNATLPVEVRVYLDPADPDSPTNPSVVQMTQTKLGRNRFRGMLTGTTGAACQRAMVEVKFPAGTVDGALRGLAVYAETLPQFGIK